MDKIIVAIRELLELLLRNFGPTGTLLIGLGVALSFVGWKLVARLIKSREVDKALAAKDQTIQHLAQENRELRAAVYKKLGWSDELIEKIVLRNVPRDSIEARELLESDDEETDP